MPHAPARVSKSPLALAALVLLTAMPVHAQDAWNPFQQLDAPRPGRKRPAEQAPADPRPYLSPMEREGPDASERPSSIGAGRSRDMIVHQQDLPPLDERSRAVAREELSPVMAGDGSGLPQELWRGLDIKTVEDLIAALEIPPRSAALHHLWKRLVTSEAAAPGGSGAQVSFQSLRAEALFRSGLVRESLELLRRHAEVAQDPILGILQARAELALGNRETACDLAKDATSKSGLPKPVRAEAILMSGYCAALSKNAAAAGLAAEIAREEGAEPSPGLAALDALAVGTKPSPIAAKTITITDYRLIELAGAVDKKAVIAAGTPPVLVAISSAPSDPALRLSAGEAAARLNAISPEQLADIYRAQPTTMAADQLLTAQGAALPGDGALRRAGLFKSAEAEQTPFKKVRLIRAFLDDARRAGLYLPALQIAAQACESVNRVPEIGWFAETGVEAALAASNLEQARAWAGFGAGLEASGKLDHWHALIDIAEVGSKPDGRAKALETLEALALRGRFSADLLHRLATVLDALDYHVPIPLWEAASRTPQPTGGHLPATGVLTALQDASKKKEFGRTVLLAMSALGPSGAEGANLISLGDSIRALRRAGLEGDARRLAFEALFAGWPRALTN